MAAYKIPLKGGQSLTLEDGKSKEFSNDVYHAIFLAGLKDFTNRGMTKVGPLRNCTPEQLEVTKTKIMEVAQKNLQNLLAGRLPRQVGVKGDKVSGVVQTEARRLAREFIKDQIKENGGRISWYSPKDITAAANDLLKEEEGKAMLEQAKANVEARSKAVAEKPKATLDELHAKLGIKADPQKVRASEAATAKKKEAGKILSAAKAGQLRVRTQQPQPRAH